MERDYWLPRGTDKAGASAHLVELAEWLGCRSEPHALPRHQAVCLARGREAILAAVERAGGHAWARQLAESDPAAAFCLCLSLQQAVADSRRYCLPHGARRRVEAAFAPLGPSYMRMVAAQLREGVPGSAQRALAVVRLQGGSLRMHCKCCTQGSDARKSERLAQKVRWLGPEGHQGLMYCRQARVATTDSHMLGSLLYTCTVMPCHRPAPFAMLNECVLLCFSCNPDLAEVAYALGCSKLRRMASGCCAQWSAPCQTARRGWPAQCSSSSSGSSGSSSGSSLPSCWGQPLSCTSAASGCRRL